MPLLLRSVAALCAAALCCLAVLLLGASPAQAARTVDVLLTSAAPPEVQLHAGDSVRFVNGESTDGLPVEHRVRSAEGPTAWEYDSGPLAPGATSAPFVLPGPGTFAYVDRRGGVLLGQDRSSRIVVSSAPPPSQAPAPAAPAPAAPPAGPAAPAPAPGAEAPAPPAGPAAPAPVPPVAAGSGTADLPGLVGGFDVPAPAGADGAIEPPSVAGALGQSRSAAGASRETVLAVEGPLPGNRTPRPLGLPAAVAVLAAAGVLSLIVRVLLAEPAARRPAVRPLVPVALD